MTKASRSGRTGTQARTCVRGGFDALVIRSFALALGELLAHSYAEGVADGFEAAMRSGLPEADRDG